MAGSWNISLFIVLYGQALCSTRICLKMGKLGTKKAFVKKTENHKVYSLIIWLKIQNFRLFMTNS